VTLSIVWIEYLEHYNFSRRDFNHKNAKERKQQKTYLTPVLSLSLLTGGNKERIGGSLKRIASRSLERRDQAALCTPSAGIHY